MTERHTRRGPGRPSANGPTPPTDEEILTHGLAAFVELGYDGASMRELARRLGVSHNFINDRYGSKLAFWQAVVDHALEDVTRSLAPVLHPEAAAVDDAARLTAVVRRFYEISARTPLLNQLMMEESHRASERLDYLVERYIGPTLAAVQPSVQRLVDSGRMPPTPIYMLYAAVIGPVIAMTGNPMMAKLGQPADRQESEMVARANELARVILDGMLGPRPPAL
ncbi:TetR/AcrR family transcriptional regulator [Nonomuraea endophytica]|uniref:TetR/AcrR family transcriptional regulator n=1 Tax=Nonomuraea endophytica TaxID=714136 RepID=UPI0037C94CEF